MNRESTALFRSACNLESSIVRTDNAADNVQAEPESSLSAIHDFAIAIKFLPQSAHCFRTHAHTIVRHRKDNARINLGNVEIDLPFLAGIL